MPASDWKSQLAGLQMPAEPSAWPPSPVAAFLALTLMVLVCALIWWALRRWQASLWRREALAELQRIRAANNDPVQLSRLLRRVARYRHSARDAALGDADFAQFLARSSGQRVPLELAQDLASCAHRPQVMLDERHTQAAAIWIRSC